MNRSHTLQALLNAPTIETRAAILATPLGYLSIILLLAFTGYALRLLLKTVPRKDIILAGLVLAILTIVELIAIPHFVCDIGDVIIFQTWSTFLGARGLTDIYTHTGGEFFGLYPPGALYPLWISGQISHLIPYVSFNTSRELIAIPILIASAGISLTLFAVLYQLGPHTAWIGMAMFALNPAAIYDSTVWGETDALHVFAMVLSLAMIDIDIPLAWAGAALAFLTKPLAATIYPVLGLRTIVDANMRIWWRSLLAFMGAIAVLCLPFFIGHPIGWYPPNLYNRWFETYHIASFNAFNVIALMGGLRIADSATVAGWTYNQIGAVMVIGVYLVILVRFLITDASDIWMAAFLCAFALFLFGAQQHERYIYASIPLMIPAVLRHKVLIPLFILLTVSAWLNMIWVLRALPLPWMPTTCAIVNVFVFTTVLAYWYGQLIWAQSDSVS